MTGYHDSANCGDCRRGICQVKPPTRLPGKVNVIWLKYPDISHEFLTCTEAEKFDKLINILKETKKHTVQSVIIVNNDTGAINLMNRLKRSGFPTIHHSTSDDNNVMLEEPTIVVSTHLRMNFVCKKTESVLLINYEMPKDPEEFKKQGETKGWTQTGGKVVNMAVTSSQRNIA